MINIPPIQQSTNIKSKLISNVTQSWKVGQVLNATTQRGGEAQSNVLIKVGELTLEAKTPVALTSGQPVKLLVKSLAENSSVTKLPLLSIISNPSLTADSTNLASLKLRQFIAVQQSFTQLQQLSDKVLANQAPTDKLPNELKTLLSNLQNTLFLNPQKISSAQLKQQISNSGIFLESKILSQSNQQKSNVNLNNDFKFQLLTIKAELAALLPPKTSSDVFSLSPQQLTQLQAIIKSPINSATENPLNRLTDKLFTLLPRESIAQLSSLLSGQTVNTVTVSKELQSLAKTLILSLQQNANQTAQPLQEKLQYRLLLQDLNQQLEQSINKITGQQLQPMSRDADNFLLLLFNLTFKDQHERFDIDFRIQQETQKQDETESAWTVTLSFNFKTLGKVQSKIHLFENQLSSVFQAEYISTANKIKKLLPLLESALTTAGLNVTNLSVENGPIKNKPYSDLHINLLDENA